MGDNSRYKQDIDETQIISRNRQSSIPKAEKKTDKWTEAYRQMLAENLAAKFTKCMVTALESAELAWGKDSNQFKIYRRVVLDTFNDQMRHMKMELENYNVERITHTMTMDVVERFNENG